MKLSFRKTPEIENHQREINIFKLHLKEINILHSIQI